MKIYESAEFLQIGLLIAGIFLIFCILFIVYICISNHAEIEFMEERISKYKDIVQKRDTELRLYIDKYEKEIKTYLREYTKLENKYNKAVARLAIVEEQIEKWGKIINREDEK